MSFLSRKLTKHLLFFRNLNLYEYQSKTLLAENGCTVQRFCVLESGKLEGLEKLNGPYIIKAQIVKGDRGRGIFTSGFRGGVHKTKNLQEAIEITQRMLGQVLVTNQTGDRGALVDKVIVAECLEPFSQKYLCFAIDRIHGPSIYVSSTSDVNFDAKDEIAKQDKEKMLVFRTSLQDNLPENIFKAIIQKLDFGNTFENKVRQEIANLWQIFVKYHLLYLAINPLILSNNGHIACLDVKITIDNSSLHLPQIAALIGDNMKEPQRQLDKINYIDLGGNIGCIVNGAGLALLTNDLLVNCGGKPANFLDLNVSNNNKDDKSNILIAINELTSNAKITSILININWHPDCVQIAQILTEVKLKIPVVLRLKGINEDAAWKILEASGLKIYKVNDTEEAARKVITLSDVSVTLGQTK